MKTSYIICPCGKKINNWKKGIYQVVKKDKEGNIIFAQCFHGHTIINEEENNDNC